MRLLRLIKAPWQSIASSWTLGGAQHQQHGCVDRQIQRQSTVVDPFFSGLFFVPSMLDVRCGARLTRASIWTEAVHIHAGLDLTLIQSMYWT